MFSTTDPLVQHRAAWGGSARPFFSPPGLAPCVRVGFLALQFSRRRKCPGGPLRSRQPPATKALGGLSAERTGVVNAGTIKKHGLAYAIVRNECYAPCPTSR